MTNSMDKTASRVSDERLATLCSEWPNWLHGAVTHATEVADKNDWSTEQVVGYAILRSLSSDSVSDGSKGVSETDELKAARDLIDVWCDKHATGMPPVTARDKLVTDILSLTQSGPTVRVRVKPLKWIGHTCPTTIGIYRLKPVSGQWVLTYEGSFPAYYHTLDEAKAAAKADYGQRILSALDSGTGEQQPVAWRPMRDAPRGFPIVVKQGQWVATVILNPPSEEGHWTDGDSVIHYNGNILVAGFRGAYEGWLPVDFAAPTEPKAGVVSEDMVERACSHLASWGDPEIEWFDHRGDIRSALTAALNGDAP